MLPAQRSADVAVTRCPWSVIASAPPAHSALTTDWMSCCVHYEVVRGGSPPGSCPRGARRRASRRRRRPRRASSPRPRPCVPRGRGRRLAGASPVCDRSATSAVRASTCVARSAHAVGLAVHELREVLRVLGLVAAREARVRREHDPGEREDERDRHGGPDATRARRAARGGDHRPGCPARGSRPWCSRDRLLPGADEVDGSASCVGVVLRSCGAHLAARPPRAVSVPIVCAHYASRRTSSTIGDRTCAPAEPRGPSTTFARPMQWSPHDDGRGAPSPAVRLGAGAASPTRTGAHPRARVEVAQEAQAAASAERAEARDGQPALARAHDVGSRRRVAWIVLFYLSGPKQLPVPPLGAWNLGVGFALHRVAGRFALTTRWKQPARRRAGSRPGASGLTPAQFSSTCE